MVCLQCGAKTHVINSRLQKRNNRVWRRRQCLGCQAIFTTTEEALYAALWAVQGKNGKITPFSRDKLLLSLYKSCGHRPRALEDASELTDTVISKLAALSVNGLLGATVIARVSQVVLSRFDKAASTHYQAFHQV